MRAFMGAVVLLILAALAAPGLALAGPAAAPAVPIPAGRWSLALVGGYLLEQRFKDCDLARANSAGASDVQTLASRIKDDQMLLLRPAWGATDWLTLYGLAGVAAGGSLRHDNLSSGQNWRASLKTGLVWGLGVQARAWSHPNGLALDLGAQYLRYDDRPLKDWRDTSAGYNAGQQWNTDDHISYWQVDLTTRLRWSLGRWTPHLGAGWTQARTQYDGQWTGGGKYQGRIDYQADSTGQDQFLGLAGLALELRPGLSLGLEASFLARTETTLGLAWEF